LLGRGGVDLRTAQELAGHSTPVLTARYSHRRLYDLAGAVEKLPKFLPDRDYGPDAEHLRATGTDGQELSTPPVLLTGRLTGPTAIPPHPAASESIGGMEEDGRNERHKCRNDKPLDARKHPVASSGIRVGEGTRTPDIQIHSYTLSLVTHHTASCCDSSPVVAGIRSPFCTSFTLA